MIPIFDPEDPTPNISLDRETRKRLRDRMDRLRTDPEYRARQRLKAQIGADNSHIARGLRNTKVTLPKFSWDN
jgi:hypothetical protein